jgi:hypothetical protein
MNGTGKGQQAAKSTGGPALACGGGPKGAGTRQTQQDPAQQTHRPAQEGHGEGDDQAGEGGGQHRRFQGRLKSSKEKTANQVDAPSVHQTG